MNRIGDNALYSDFLPNVLSEFVAVGTLRDLKLVDTSRFISDRVIARRSTKTSLNRVSPEDVGGAGS